ncbi:MULTISPECIES: hypothetical protein [Nonomuraea]|uniref:Nif11 domain-containing protein n=1 Tax=Nonomuraea mangrovi TaxID=2316207 RepID=A0ABW4T0B4_9ACTN
MSTSGLIDFLRGLADRPELLDRLKDKPKSEVIAAAGGTFTEEEFNSFVWDLEERLAKSRGEAFDAEFSLWHLLWGQYYLEFLVHDLVPTLDRERQL